MRAVLYFIKQNKNEQRIAIYISELHIYDTQKIYLKKQSSIIKLI